MKKTIKLFVILFTFYSCLNSDNDRLRYDFEFLPIDEFMAPSSFTFGEKDTIKLKYTLKNGCYDFDGIYYEYADTTRIVAVRALISLDEACTLAISQNEYDLVVEATQEEDYVFKFFKGKDNNGENIFEEVVVPVN